MTDHFKSRSKRYAVVLVRWLGVAAFVFIATAATGIYVTEKVLPKAYSAIAVMAVEPKPVPEEQFSGWAFSSPQVRENAVEVESIESPQVLEAVAVNLDLDHTWAARLARKVDPLAADETMQMLESHLQVQFKHGTNVVEVTATSDVPKEAADIANSVVLSYKAVRDTSPAAGKDGKPPVQILERASVPEMPSRPNKHFCFAVTGGLAGLLGVMIASAVEMCLLIARAEESAREFDPVR